MCWKFSLSGLDEVHRRHVSDIDRMQSDLSLCRLEVQRLATERPQLSDRYHYFQVTRGYVHDLADCLTTKVRSHINLPALPLMIPLYLYFT